jgi:hypothetical protein
MEFKRFDEFGDGELDQRDLVRVVVINGQPVGTRNTVVLLAEGSASRASA